MAAVRDPDGSGGSFADPSPQGSDSYVPVPSSDPAMSQDLHTVTIRISVRWWVPAYLAILSFIADCMGTEPDSDKVGQFIVRHGIKTRVM